MTRYHDFMIFGSHSVYCGLCHGSPETCRCDIRRYDDDPIWDALFARSQDMLAAMAEEALEDFRACHTADQELAARKTVVAQANATCPTCGQTMPTDTRVSLPNQLEETQVDDLPPPSGWRDREPLL